MTKSFLINNNSPNVLTPLFGVVAEIVPSHQNGTAILCVLSPEDIYEDYRAVLGDASTLHVGDSILFRVHNEIDGDPEDDETSYCIYAIERTNDSVFVSPLEWIALG